MNRQTTAAQPSSQASASPPSLVRTLMFGGLGFCAASVCVFATVAFAEGWMYRHLGLWGAYLVWTALFILLGGGVMGRRVTGPWRLPKFYLLFGSAFFAYAAGWIAAYFLLRGAVGEWIGAFVGSSLMGMVFAAGFGVLRSAWLLSLVLFVANSAGYFIGSALNNAVQGRAGMLLWGIAYGLFFGAGLGAVLHLAQSRKDPR